ncbi:MAG: hypothetical protein ACM3MF_07970 [Anaerolineae bacterium]
MGSAFAFNAAWILAAALLGFVISALSAGVLRLSRRVFVLVYFALTAPFLYAFFRWSRLDIHGLVQHNWIWGLALAALVGAFLVRNVRAQPRSAAVRGFALVWDVIWLGVVYGTLDALLLSVLPVLATWQAFSGFEWAGSVPGKMMVSVFALIASLVVTVVYHLGYPEYRQRRGVVGPSIGNTVMSLGYVLADNPLSAVFSHIAMHIAGVLHGPASVVQLPPHYRA